MKKINKSLRISVKNSFINGISDVIVKGLTSGNLLSVYALGIGISNIGIGFLQSILPFANLVHILVAKELEKGKSSRKIAWISSFVSRPFLLIAAISVFFKDSAAGKWLFILSYTVSYLFSSVSGGVFWAWCRGFIPKNMVTSFLAKRMQVTVFARIVVILAATFVIYLANRYTPKYEVYYYSLFFVIAFAAGMVSTKALYNIPDAKLKCLSDVPIMKKIIHAYSEKSFLLLFSSISFANFALAFFSAFYIVFMIKILNIPAYLAIILTLIADFTGILITQTWKKYSEKNKSAKLVLVSTIVLIFSVMLLLFLSLYSDISPITVLSLLFTSSILLGSGTSGYTLGINDATVAYVPDKMSSVNISLMNIGRFAFTGLGALFGGVILQFLNNFTYKWTSFFVLSIFLFFGVMIFTKYIKPAENYISR